MKNVNIFVDVDLTLLDANGKLMPGAKEALLRLKEEGCHLFLWSSVGTEYAKKVAQIHQLTDLFEAFTAKPDVIIDDMPATTAAPFSFAVQDGSDWQVVAEKIITKHLG